MTPLDIYKELFRYDDLYVQSNLNGYYEQRVKCNPENIFSIEHNHRKIGIPEVVFDIDCHVRELSHQIKNSISSNLIQDNISHTIWDTSRSPHIHCYFEGLNLYPKDVRNTLKKIILRHYSKGYERWIDFLKSSENHMIRDFNCKHEVTGKNKTMKECFYNSGKTLLNPVQGYIIEELMQTLNIKKEWQNKVRINQEGKEQLVLWLEFCLSHRFDKLNSGRSTIYYKNVAITLLLLSYNEVEVKEISKKISRNCLGTKEDEIYKWWKWFSTRQNTEFNVNFHEIEKFLKSYGQNLQNIGFVTTSDKATVTF